MGRALASTDSIYDEHGVGRKNDLQCCWRPLTAFSMKREVPPIDGIRNKAKGYRNP
jgi:hypothetical protein